MASAQGYVRYGGLPVARCFYSAYYKSNNGGSPGPGAGQRASQWLSGVYLTEDNGIYSIALSSDNALGAAATVSNGDQLVVLFWRLSTSTPTQAGGTFFSGQSRTDGSGGTHPRGFKSNNGAAINYAACDFVRSLTFTMTGNAWNATPGGIGGSANGDVDLLLNGAPAAALAGVSTVQATPTPITRSVAYSFVNASADDVLNKLYTFNNQVLLEAMSAAHNPGDSTSAEGSKYTFSAGLTYGASFGTPVGGDTNGADFSAYAGPLFKSHSHTFPSVDVYRVVLDVRDDSEPSLTASATYYVKTSYRTPSFVIAARRWCSWDQYITNPLPSNTNFSPSNPDTVNDVVSVQATLTDLDSSAGSPTALRTFAAAFTFTGGVQTVNQTGIGLGCTAPAFMVVRTQGGMDVRKSFRVTAASADSVTIDTAGDTSTVSTRDWYGYATEPAGGTSPLWDWEVDDGTGWRRVGGFSGAFASAVSGLSVHVPGIGQDAIPGWYLNVIDGPGRSITRITQVIDDDTIVLASAINAQAGDHFEVGCRNKLDAVWAQSRVGTLNFRIVATYSTGWVHTQALAAVVQNGTVNNIPPQAVVSKAAAAGSATTYTFDGLKSYGTQTAWVQDTAFMLSHTLNGLSTCQFSDPAINTTGLRDGHAWLTVLDAFGVIVAVHKIVDIDRESPLPSVVTLEVNGSTATYPAGTKFRTTNVYESAGVNNDNDIVGYAWDLRSAPPSATPPVVPTSHADFTTRFDRSDGTGSGDIWAYTYSESDADRWACVELTVTDDHGAVNTTWQVFLVTISTAPPVGTSRPRRVEWD